MMLVSDCHDLLEAFEEAVTRGGNRSGNYFILI